MESSTLVTPIITFDNGLRQDFESIEVDAEMIGGFMSKVGFADSDIADTHIHFDSELPRVLKKTNIGGFHQGDYIQVNATRLALCKDDEAAAENMVRVLGHEIGHHYDYVNGRLVSHEVTTAQKVKSFGFVVGAMVTAACATYISSAENSNLTLATLVATYPDINLATSYRSIYKKLRDQDPHKSTDMFMRYSEELAMESYYAHNPDERSATGFSVVAKLLLADSIRVGRSEEQLALHDKIVQQRRALDPLDIFIGYSYPVD